MPIRKTHLYRAVFVVCLRLERQVEFALVKNAGRGITVGFKLIFGSDHCFDFYKLEKYKYIKHKIFLSCFMRKIPFNYETPLKTV